MQVLSKAGLIKRSVLGMKQRIKKKLAWLIALCMLAICLPLSIAMTEGEAASGAASPSEPEETDFSSKTRAIPPSSIDFE